MIVDLDMEFGYELAVAVPHAYYASLHNNLESTTSCLDTKIFYPFSKNHKEKYIFRKGNNYGDTFPNHNIERTKFSEALWTPPPLKEIYKNNLFSFNKPPLIILNKYCIEFGKQPYNFINEMDLNLLFSLLKHKYQIIYYRYKGEGINDYSWIEKKVTNKLEDEKICLCHPEVITLEQLHLKHPNFSLNTMQVMLYANVDNYISVSGGTSIFISYFAKQTVMFVKECRDVKNNSHKGWYKQLYGNNIIDVNTSENLIKTTKEVYL